MIYPSDIRFLGLFLFFIVNVTIPAFSQSPECKPVTIADFPAKDLPGKTEKALHEKANAKQYYDGIGVKVDYTKARYSAFGEIENKRNGDIIDEYTVLMMLYANGLDIERNLDLRISWKTMITKERIKQLEKIVDEQE